VTKAPLIKLHKDLLALLRQPSICYIATSMADGSPQLTQTWVDTDGEHVIINSVQGYVKLKNIELDPRVAVAISERDNPSRYYQIRGRVVDVTTDGAVAHIEMLAQKYLGTPYPWYGGREQVRVIIVIAPDEGQQHGIIPDVPLAESMHEDTTRAGCAGDGCGGRVWASAHAAAVARGV